MALNDVHNNNIYSKVEFPEYKFQEFPKVVALKDGTTTIAENKHHELQIIATDGTVSLNPENHSERDALLAHIKKQELEIAEMRQQMLQSKATQITIQANMPPPDSVPPPASAPAKPSVAAAAKPTPVTLTPAELLA